MKAITNKKSLIVLMPLLVGLGIFMVGTGARAGGWAEDILTGILSIFIWALGIILGLVLQGLIAIASQQHFIDSQAVVLGWVIVRDICNMFFVVVLMIIAFGTILHLEEYNYKKWLPKLILMAVLINFSKTICGILIDVTQVAMLTFVNAFKDIGGGNATEMLGIKDIVTLSASDSGTGTVTIVGAYVLGIIYLIVSIVVIVTMMMMLAMRLVMIWIYVVLSPAAYLLAAFPGGQKYSSQWWSEFVKNLIVGPVLAFFIWLSLAALGTGNDMNNIDTATADKNNQQYNDTLKGDSFAGTEASRPSALIKFVVAIGMLVGGLMVSQQIGGAAGGLAGKGMSKLQAGAAFAGRMAGKGALLPLKGLQSGASYGIDKLHQKTGVDLNVARVWKGIKSKKEELKEKRYGEGQLAARQAMEEGGRFHGILAMSGNSADAWEQATSWKGIGKRLKGGKYMAKKKEKALPAEHEAQREFEDAKYEDQFAHANTASQAVILADATERKTKAEDERSREEIKNRDLADAVRDEDAKGQYKDNDRLKDLQVKKAASDKALHSAQENVDAWDARETFATMNSGHVFTPREQFDIKNRKNEAEHKLDKAKKKVDANIPEYNFEARAEEQKLVSNETSKIKDISDPTELLRILQDAIASRDKTMAKAIMLKMTKDANDNEYLQPLVGNTGHHGLKDLMRQLSTEGSKNYAGFSQQEAFGLGSQIAEVNKNTNHWAATSAYTMDNGQFRETTDREHNIIRDKETGKQQLQAFIRNNNRLAYGDHDENGEFHLDAGGVIKLMAIDNKDGHQNIQTMNESAAKYVYDAILKDPKLLAHFNDVDRARDEGMGETLVARLATRLGHLAAAGSSADKVNSASDLGYT